MYQQYVEFAWAFAEILYRDGQQPPFDERGIYAAIKAFCEVCTKNASRFDEVLFLEKVHEFRNRMIQEDLENHYREEE